MLLLESLRLSLNLYQLSNLLDKRRQQGAEHCSCRFITMMCVVRNHAGHRILKIFSPFFGESIIIKVFPAEIFLRYELRKRRGRVYVVSTVLYRQYVV
jgi:hypothetical protein